jgi:hypothetical protein
MAVLALNILQHLSSGLGDRMRREMQRRGFQLTPQRDSVPRHIRHCHRYLDQRVVSSLAPLGDLLG